MRAYAVPKRFCSTMYATEGHITAGISENAIPIMDTGRKSEMLLYAMTRQTGISRTEPTIMKEARFPTLSTNSPHSGVAIMADSGTRLLKKPAFSWDRTRTASLERTPPYPARILLVKKSIANVRNGKIAE